MPEPCYIPSKMLIHCADVMQTDQTSTAVCIHAKLESIDRQFIVKPAFEKVYADAAMIKSGYRQSENVEVLKGHGRFTNTDILEVSNTSVELYQRGYINTNKYFETSVPGIWARAISWSAPC